MRFKLYITLFLLSIPSVFALEGNSVSFIAGISAIVLLFFIFFSMDNEPKVIKEMEKQVQHDDDTMKKVKDATQELEDEVRRLKQDLDESNRRHQERPSVTEQQTSSQNHLNPEVTAQDTTSNAAAKKKKKNKLKKQIRKLKDQLQQQSLQLQNLMHLYAHGRQVAPHGSGNPADSVQATAVAINNISIHLGNLERFIEVEQPKETEKEIDIVVDNIHEFRERIVGVERLIASEHKEVLIIKEMADSFEALRESLEKYNRGIGAAYQFDKIIPKDIINQDKKLAQDYAEAFRALLKFNRHLYMQFTVVDDLATFKQKYKELVDYIAFSFSILDMSEMDIINRHVQIIKYQRDLMERYPTSKSSLGEMFHKISVTKIDKDLAAGKDILGNNLTKQTPSHRVSQVHHKYVEALVKAKKSLQTIIDILQQY